MDTPKLALNAEQYSILYYQAQMKLDAVARQAVSAHEELEDLFIQLLEETEPNPYAADQPRKTPRFLPFQEKFP